MKKADLAQPPPRQPEDKAIFTQYRRVRINFGKPDPKKPAAKQKTRYYAKVNLKGETLKLETTAVSEKQARQHIIAQVAKRLNVVPGKAHVLLAPTTENVLIQLTPF